MCQSRISREKKPTKKQDTFFVKSSIPSRPTGRPIRGYLNNLCNFVRQKWLYHQRFNGGCLLLIYHYLQDSQKKPWIVNILGTPMITHVHAHTVVPSGPPPAHAAKDCWLLHLEDGAKTQPPKCSQTPNFGKALYTFARIHFNGMQTCHGQQM